MNEVSLLLEENVTCGNTALIVSPVSQDRKPFTEGAAYQMSLK